MATAEMWSVLSNLGRRFGDQRLVGGDLRGSEAAIEHLPRLDMALPASAPAFLPWLRQIAPGRSEPLYVDARIVAFVGDSLLWGLWVNQDAELAILGLPRVELGTLREELGAWGGGPWYEAVEVEKHTVPLARWPRGTRWGATRRGATRIRRRRRSGGLARKS